MKIKSMFFQLTIHVSLLALFLSFEASNATNKPQRFSSSPPSVENLIGNGTSLLQFEESAFRLLTGMAYRVFRENYAQDYHEHVTVRDMPYLFEPFVILVKDFRDLLFKLPHFNSTTNGIVDKQAWNELVDELQNELERANQNIVIEPIADTQIGPNYLNGSNNMLLRLDEKGQIIRTTSKVAFWYDKFLPLLSKACSSSYISDETITETQLNRLYRNSGIQNVPTLLDDVITTWPRASKSLKIDILRAWRLTSSYISGPGGKFREREVHRFDGALSQYVPFLDFYVGTNFTAIKDMRTTFPYFIGTSTWRLHHTLAELINEMEEADQNEGVRGFVKFFTNFKELYPCPYCRHHLQQFVLVNNETDMYPVEYIMIGPKDATFETRETEKLSYIQSASDLRLFLWKLHNAVSSSIERQEEWYRQDPNPSITTRYWPSAEGIVYRANEFQNGLIQKAAIIDQVNKVFREAVELILKRSEILSIQEESNHVKFHNLETELRPLIHRLDDEMEASNFLQQAYSFHFEDDDDDDDDDRRKTIKNKMKNQMKKNGKEKKGQDDTTEAFRNNRFTYFSG